MQTTTITMTMMISAAVTAFAGEPTTAEVVSKLVEQDHARQSQMGAYSVMCRYSLQNKSRQAEMVVRWTRLANGEKRYEIVSETGDGGVRSHVFHKLLDAEVDASKPGQREKTRITPDNYNFKLVGEETLKGRSAYVLEIEPKVEAKYLTRGRIWVDAADFAVAQVEGAPSHNVSFWTKKVDFVQTFEKNGSLWLVSSNHSLTDARLFGLADLTLEYFNYQIQLPEMASKMAE